jgi:hypothetical protein
MKKLRTLALATVITMLIAAFVLISAAARTGSADEFDAATIYKVSVSRVTVRRPKRDLTLL